MLKKRGEYCNKEIRNYLRLNPHYSDEMVAEHFNVSKRVISANKAHITMGTDTDNPQVRSKVNRALKTRKKFLVLIETEYYQLCIDECGEYKRLDLKSKRVTTLTDKEAKSIMLTRLHVNYDK